MPIQLRDLRVIVRRSGTNKYAVGSPFEFTCRVAGVLDSLPRFLEKETMLWVDLFGLTTCHVEESRIKLINAVEKTTPANVRKSLRWPASRRDLCDGRLALAQILPKGLKISRSRETPGDSNDCDRFECWDGPASGRRMFSCDPVLVARHRLLRPSVFRRVVRIVRSNPPGIWLQLRLKVIRQICSQCGYIRVLERNRLRQLDPFLKLV